MAMRSRQIRMEDDPYEAMARLAVARGRTIAEEMRLAVDAWLMANGVDVSPTRRTVTPHANQRKNPPRS